jgi:hypothetical protein
LGQASSFPLGFFGRDRTPIRIRQPRRNLQIKFTGQIDRTDFVAYIDAIGKLDGARCLREWKTSSSRYADEPERRLALDR